MGGLDGDKSPALGDGIQSTDAMVFSYDPGARRDPFRSLVIRERKAKGGTPLQQRGVAEIKLVGIVWESEGYSAMVETPDGKGFTLRVGTPVGPSGGKVKRITEKSVIIQEITRDFAGLKKSKETVIGLRTKEEELE
jgi:type IV pilus assembly protein PilP